MKKPNSNGADEVDAAEDGIAAPAVKPLTCGIVMPISSIDNCSPEHWQDVKQILFEAADMAGFDPHLVSDAEDVGIIQKRIIQNLYENPIVVCDVSGKNPNVMFELGIRLAFDKPTIIVKDDKTSYSFDTAPIEHLEYPRDLRFNKIVDFKEGLSEKIKATHQRAASDSNYTTFLKHFGTFSVAKIETKEVSKETFIIEQLQQLQRSVNEVMQRSGDIKVITQSAQLEYPRQKVLCLLGASERIATEVGQMLSLVPGVDRVEETKTNDGHVHFSFYVDSRDTEIVALSNARQMRNGARYLPSEEAKLRQKK